MNVKLKNNPIWHKFTKIIAQIDVNAIVSQHLEDCNYTVNGYWDESDFYEEITFVGSLCTELISSSLGITVGAPDNSHWIELKFLLKADTFLLKADTSADSAKLISDVEKRIGELILIFDENLEFIDENWLIDVKSPFVVAKRGQDLNQKLLQV